MSLASLSSSSRSGPGRDPWRGPDAARHSARSSTRRTGYIANSPAGNDSTPAAFVCPTIPLQSAAPLPQADARYASHPHHPVALAPLSLWIIFLCACSRADSPSPIRDCKLLIGRSAARTGVFTSAPHWRTPGQRHRNWN